MSNEHRELAVLDRIEDDGQAVLLVGEAEHERVVPAGELPAGTRPGTWLRVRFEGDRLVEAVVDTAETERARQRIHEKMQRLRRRGRGLT